MNALLHPEATEDSLRKAIDKSWKYYRNQYQNYPLDPSINYPNEAWARSQGSGTLTIELPPGETLITNPVYLPANISLRGSGVWAGSTLRMRGNGQLVLLGEFLRPGRICSRQWNPAARGALQKSDIRVEKINRLASPHPNRV